MHGCSSAKGKSDGGRDRLGQWNAGATVQSLLLPCCCMCDISLSLSSLCTQHGRSFRFSLFLFPLPFPSRPLSRRFMPHEFLHRLSLYPIPSRSQLQRVQRVAGLSPLSLLSHFSCHKKKQNVWHTAGESVGECVRRRGVWKEEQGELSENVRRCSGLSGLGLFQQQRELRQPCRWMRCPFLWSFLSWHPF